MAAKKTKPGGLGGLVPGFENTQHTIIRKYCEGCGRGFIARQAWHRYCSRCFRDGQIRAYLEMAAKLLRENRGGGND